MEGMRSPIESGCPDGFQYMHPLMRKNYGNWAYHEDPRPGVLKHTAHGGEAIYTVRAGTQRILDVFTLRKLCDIGDEFADGYVRFLKDDVDPELLRKMTRVYAELTDEEKEKIDW